MNIKDNIPPAFYVPENDAVLEMTTVTDPGSNVATSVTNVDNYSGVIVLLTTGGVAQTIQSPTDTTAGRVFTVVNDASSSTYTIAVNGFTITAGEAQSFIWDSAAWGPTDLGITAIPVLVVQGGTGLATITDHGIMLGSGTGAVTPLAALAAGEIIVGVGGADPHALAAGATTKVLVGGGAADPVWTEATGTGAPVRATSPTLVTPLLGTPTSGDLSNCSLATPPAIGGTTANTLRAKFDEDLEPATDSISTNQCAGGVINNVGQSGNAILTLPAAAEGYNFTVILGVTAAFYFRILTLDAANDKIYLDGVAGSDDGYVQVASAAVGNTIQFFTFQTAAGVYDWYACTVSGSWVAG